MIILAYWSVINDYLKKNYVFIIVTIGIELFQTGRRPMQPSLDRHGM